MNKLKHISIYLMLAVIILLSCKKQDDDINTDPISGDIEVQLPGGEYEMSDHFGFVERSRCLLQLA